LTSVGVESVRSLLRQALRFSTLAFGQQRYGFDQASAHDVVEEKQRAEGNLRYVMAVTLNPTTTAGS
jgi:hypothetical protein